MSRKRPLVPTAAGELENFKIEIGKELGLIYHNSDHKEKGDPSMNIGGEMVKRMVKDAEEKMVRK